MSAGRVLYPRSRVLRDKSHLRWRVRYDLAYDGGGGSWDGYYRTQIGAQVSAFLNVHVLSWGGSAILHDQSAPPSPGDGEPTTDERTDL